MSSLIEYAYAKLNISLDVTGKMDDGYHSMLMVMQSASLCDDVKICITKGTGTVSVNTDKAFLPRDEKNLAGVAVKAFMQRTGITGWDTDVSIIKRIPVCAGLGGGSSDVAAVLRGLNVLFAAGMTQDELEDIGKAIGSDVPYCIAGGTRLAQRRGELLCDLAPLPKCYAVICKPSFSVSTPELFSKLDVKKIKCRPDTDGIVAALRAGDIKGVGRRMYNIFEDVLPKGKEYVEHIKGVLYDNNAVGAVMSGTGSAVFGLFTEKDRAQNACEQLSRSYRECFLAETTEKLEI